MSATANILRAMGDRICPLASDGSLVLAKATRQSATAIVVRQMCADGLTQAVSGGVQRTAEGRAFLRRALATAVERADGQEFAAQHRTISTGTVSEGKTTVPVSRNAAESPLAWLASRKDKAGAPYIDTVQCAAGERLYRDFALGHQAQRVTQSWDASGARGSRPRDGMSVSDVAHSARQRVERALGAVGRDLSDALYGVCCEELGLEAVEKRCGWPLRSGKLVLRIALDRLAEHYGIAAEACGGDRGRMVQWGTADYRPHA